MLVRGHVAVADFTDEAISRPGRARRGRQGPLRDAGLSDLPPGVPRRRAASRSPTGETFEGDFPIRRAARRTRSRTTRCVEKFRGNAALALSDGAVEALDDSVLALDAQGRSHRSAGAAHPTPSSEAVTGLTTEQQRDRRRGPRVRRPRRDPGRLRARASRTSTRSSSSTTMVEMGLFGTTIPEEYGGLGLGLDTYALIVMELSRGWVTLSGILNGTFIAAWMIRMHGTEEQRQRLLPRLASCEIRSSFSMTEPHAGSDVQSIRTTAVRDGDDYVIAGQKMWVTNGWRSGIIMLLAKTDPAAGSAAYGHDRIHRREGAGDEPARSDDPDARSEEARLQGRRVDRARVRRLPHACVERARRRGGGRARASSTS